MGNKKWLRRVIVVVLDSVGVGELPDAADYGDEGSNTLVNTAAAVGGLALPNFGQLGLGNIVGIQGVPPAKNPRACFGKLAEKSVGKDTTTGHWELAGLHLPNHFPHYPEGFPDEIIEPFKKKIGRSILGNMVASGTEIIKELGEEHLKTGYPIVYTSADSVFQITAHEQVISVDDLYEICMIARNLLIGEHSVARVIARPFIGEVGNFKRTARRRDFSLEPPEDTVLDYAHRSGVPVCTVGKVDQIFAGRGVSQAVHTENNMDGIEKIIEVMSSAKDGIIFANLVDFDALWGHRNNPQGYAGALEEVDRRIPEILSALDEADVLIFTADHGCDPTTPSTDHSREYVPLLVSGKQIKAGVDLGVGDTFANVGKTIADLLGFEAPIQGESIVKKILRSESFK